MDSITNCDGVKNIIVALPDDIMMLIISKLDLLSFHCFSAVCKSWKSIAADAKKIMLPQFPWLMLSSSDDHHDGFFSFSHNRILKLKLPPKVDGGWCCGSNWGWLLMVSKLGCYFLLNPFTKDLIELPPKPTLPTHLSFYSYIRKTIFLSPPTAADCVVIAIYCKDCLVFWRRGDEKWTVIENHYFVIEDIIFYNGKVYAIDWGFNLITVEELGSHPNSANCKIAPPAEEELCFPTCSDRYTYLVECLGELLMVIRYRVFVDSELSNTIMFKIFKLDTEGKCWIKVEDLGDQMLFIDKSTSLSLSALDYFGFKRNCIYFTDEYPNKFGLPICQNLGVFQLKNENIDFFSLNYSHSSLYLPIWFTPIW